MQSLEFNSEQDSSRARSNLLSSGRGRRIYGPTCRVLKCPPGKCFAKRVFIFLPGSSRARTGREGAEGAEGGTAGTLTCMSTVHARLGD